MKPVNAAAALRQSDRRVSIRLRLTLWNVGVLVLILFGMGTVLRYALEATLISAIDHDLEHGVRGIQEYVKQNGTLPPPPTGAPRPQNRPGLGPQIRDASGRNVSWFRETATPYGTADFRTALATRRPVYATITWNGELWRVFSYPVRQDNGKVDWVVQMPRPLRETQLEVARLTRLLFILAGPGVLLAGLGGAFLTNRALRPVRLITQAAARIEAEDLSRRLTVTGKDELSELSLTFNGMLARLEEAFRQRQAAYDRMEKAYEQQQRFTADASHELKSPLTVIEGTVSLNLSSAERTPAQYRKALETIGSSAGRMTRIVQDLLLLARSDAGHLELEMRPVSLYEVMTLARDALVNQERDKVRAQVLLPETDPHVFVRADPNHLVRLLVNLLENALRHTPADGTVRLTLDVDSNMAQVTVADTGSGIPAKDLPHIFDRFYRVDAARARTHGGTGLGLAISRSIAEAHGGSLTIDSDVGRGTDVFLRLPRLDK